MDIHTILNELFKPLMKNGKRIKGTRVLMFGTRIFFDKYLDEDDVIVCTDYADMLNLRRRGYKKIVFIPESFFSKMFSQNDDMCQYLTKKMYNYIMRKFNMRKFDLTITNPPYDGDLHLKIINELVKMSKTVVAVHPGRWVEDVLAPYKNNGATGKRFQNLKVMLEQIRLYSSADGKKAFHIGLDQDMMIGIYCESDSDPKLPIYKNSDTFYGVLDKIIAHLQKDGKNNRNSLESHCEKNKVDGVRVQVLAISPRSHDGDGCMSELAKNSFVYITGDKSFVDGKNAKGEFWIVADGKRQNQFTVDENGNPRTDKPFPLSVRFDTIEEANDFIHIYRSTVVKNIVHMLKYDMNKCISYIPYFDPKVIKTEDDVLDALGITNEEHRKWMKRPVDDYRKKDFIKYNEWIDC